jgi:hypothetical protein
MTTAAKLSRALNIALSDIMIRFIISAIIGKKASNVKSIIHQYVITFRLIKVSHLCRCLV